MVDIIDNVIRLKPVKVILKEWKRGIQLHHKNEAYAQKILRRVPVNCSNGLMQHFLASMIKKKYALFVAKNKRWCLTKKYEYPISCERDDVEDKIKSVAKVRNDKRVLLDVEGRDFKALLYNYHRTCFVTYTNKKTLSSFQRIAEKQSSDTITDAFEKVCATID